MAWNRFWIVLALCLSGCADLLAVTPEAVYDIRPVTELPVRWRATNYGPSCGWASTESALRIAGKTDAADWLRKNRSGPSSSGNINPALDQLGLKYVYTVDGDERLLDWAIETRRCCCVSWDAKHATDLIGKEWRTNLITKEDAWYAVILDNNQVKTYRYIPWEQFIKEWKGYGGWAWAFTYRPPLPNLVVSQ